LQPAVRASEASAVHAGEATPSLRLF